MIVADGIEARARAARAVAAGGVVAFRTDTFYGLGADPFNRRALLKIDSLKGREGKKPILVVIADAAQADRFVAGRSRLFDLIASHHWPGALTLVAKARSEVPEEITAGTGTIGVRLPDDDAVRAFVRACGGALTATSANLAGEPSARTAQEVLRYFPTELDLIIDGGEARTDRPSTVLDVGKEAPRLIREGVISREKLKRTLQTVGVQL